MPNYNKPAKVEDIHDCRNAMFSESFPCNPRPFVNTLALLIDTGQTMDRDDVRRILWVLLAQSYGQMAVVDLCDEWRRLYELYGKIDPA